jgi:hypothetical protein
MATDETERHISHRKLERHGIYYNAEVYHSPQLISQYVDDVRRMLLSFGSLLPEGGWKKTLQKERDQHAQADVVMEGLQPSDLSWIPVEDREIEHDDEIVQWKSAYKNTKSCSKVAKKARD